ncbi:hypothetical protein MKP05_12185 [Halomonas sp. EGI 63088]|uniref:Integrase n=1 Tax=Halomonas flagellata TaxID=2920385 RepID=A0ABS9RVJ6_9GAMM|nr:hypothetical protein [Halomonas flagellata]MCH4563883.1 hypothetical protein [Halomonas flagellata]
MKWRSRFVQGGATVEMSPSTYVEEGGEIKFPDDTFVISRDKEGNPLSRYGDDIWDLTPYAVKTVKLDFYVVFDLKKHEKKNPLMHKIANEMKQLMWLFMWEPFHNSGLSYKPGTLRNYLGALRGVAEIAYGEHRSLQNIHESPIAFHKVFSSIEVAGSTRTVARQLNTWANTVSFISQRYNLELPQLFELKNLRRIHESIPKRSKGHSQTRTPLIPARLYAQLLSDSQKMVNDFLEVSDKLLEMMARYQEEPSFWIVPTHTILESGNPYTNWRTATFYRRWKDRFGSASAPASTEFKWTTPEEAVTEYGLTEYFEKHPISTAHAHGSNTYSWVGLSALLSAIQTGARTLIFAYTGQRLHENRVLTFGCLSSMTIKDLGEFPLIMGRTSKMTNNNYSEELLPWATSKEAIPAIKAAEKIAKFAVTSIHRRNIDELDDSAIPLFIGLVPDKQSSAHFNLPVSGYLESAEGRANFLKTANLDQSVYVTSEADMKELCDFDVYRNWRNDRKVKKGKVWPFSSHQFRRATAVYSARSGIVSLPSLKFQFKHLHIAMTMVYRENALFAKNILAETPDPGTHAIISDFMAEINMIMATGFKSHIVDSKDSLTGGAGARFQQMKASVYPKYWDSEEELAKAINNGTMRWEQVPTGGCMKIHTCKHKGIDDVLPCRSGCADSVMGGEDGLGVETGNFLKIYKDDIAVSLDFVDNKHPSARFIQQEIDAIEEQLCQQREVPNET